MPKPHLEVRMGENPWDTKIIAVTDDGMEVDLTKVFPINRVTISQRGQDPRKIVIESDIMGGEESIQAVMDPSLETIEQIEGWCRSLRALHHAEDEGTDLSSLVEHDAKAEDPVFDHVCQCGAHYRLDGDLRIYKHAHACDWAMGDDKTKETCKSKFDNTGPKFASGGIVKSDKSIQMVFNDPPEAILPLSRDAQGRLRQVVLSGRRGGKTQLMRAQVRAAMKRAGIIHPDENCVAAGRHIPDCMCHQGVAARRNHDH